MPDEFMVADGYGQPTAENLPGMIYRFAMEPDGAFAVQFASEGAREIYGLRPEQLMEDAQLAFGCCHPEDAEAALDSIQRSARLLSRWEWHGRIVRADGCVKHVYGVSNPVREPSGTIVWDGVLLDVSALRDAEVERDEALEMFRTAFEHAPISMAVVSVDGRIERVNRATCDISGYTGDELRSMGPLQFVHPEDRIRVRKRLLAAAAGSERTGIEYRLIRPDGEIVWVQSIGALVHTTHPTVLVQTQDITAHKALEQELRHIADHDPLTGLLNRRGFSEALGRHLAYARRYDVRGALLLLDLDGFKAVNDSLGHAAGDRLIAGSARCLSSRLRETDTIGRLGGDEFAVVLPQQTAEEAGLVARSLLDSVPVCCPDILDGRELTGSIGIAIFDRRAEAPELFARADSAMYEAKRSGRNCFVVREAAEA